jgi:hypothetical protein
MTLNDNDLRLVLMEAYLKPFKLQSDFARAFAAEVSALACMGFITTLEGPGLYGRKWRITGTGLDQLRAVGIL